MRSLLSFLIESFASLGFPSSSSPTTTTGACLCHPPPRRLGASSPARRVRRRFAGQIDRGFGRTVRSLSRGRPRAVRVRAGHGLRELERARAAARVGQERVHDESLDVGSSRKRDDHALRSLRCVRLAEAHGDRAGHRGLDSVVVAAHHARLVQRVVVHLGRRGGELGAPGGNHGWAPPDLSGARDDELGLETRKGRGRTGGDARA